MSHEPSDKNVPSNPERIASYQQRYVAILAGHGYEATEQRAAFLKLMEGKEYGESPLLSAWGWFTEGQAALLAAPVSHVDAPKPQTSYEPLTEEIIERMRGAGKAGYLDTGNQAFGILCDMAINCLLYGQEIERLRALPSSERGMTEVRIGGVTPGVKSTPGVQDSAQVSARSSTTRSQPAEEVIKALRELADGYFFDPTGNKQALTIHGRTMRESIIAQALASLSATRASIIQECIERVRRNSVPGMSTEWFKGIEDGIQRSIEALEAMARSDGTGAV